MAHDGEFWRAIGETGGVLGTVLTPFALAAFAAVKKYRKEHPGEDAEAIRERPAHDAEADLVASLHEQIAFLRAELLKAQATIAEKDAALRTLYDVLDSGSRKGRLSEILPPDPP